MTDIPTITQEEAVEVRARELLAADGIFTDQERAHILAGNGGLIDLSVNAAIRAIIAALSPNMDHAVGGVRQQVREVQAYGAYMPLIVREKFLEETGAILAVLATPPVNQDAVRDALVNLLPSKLCGESWDLPDDSHVSIDITFGKLRAARKALATPPLDNTGLDAATVERPDGAIENLTNFQQQADMHGEFVKVSRQALDETLAYVAALASGDRS